MEHIRLSESLKVNIINETATAGNFEIEGLYSGYGLTLGNALRRVLLSSLPGAAITQVKIRGVGHEFTTIPGVVEDIVEISLNLKRVRFNFGASYADYPGPQIIVLKAKGEGIITAASLEKNAIVSVINPDAHILTITDKNTEVEIELTVEKGLGYVPVESFKKDTLPVGVIQLDAIFSPVRKVNFVVENMRVGDRTDFNRVRFVIETDGSLTPSAALRKSASILQDHFAKVYDQIKAIGGVEDVAPSQVVEEKTEKKSSRKSTKGSSASGSNKKEA